MWERIGWAAGAAGLAFWGLAACGEDGSVSGSGGTGGSGTAGAPSGGGAGGAPAGGAGGTGGAAAGAGGADASAGAGGSAGSGGCAPGAKQCKADTPQFCDATGKWQDSLPCQYGCDSGSCKDAGCKAGEFNCYGNQVQQCDPGPPAKWVPKLACDAAAGLGQVCNQTTGTCDFLQPLPAPTALGNCQVYAVFNTSDGVFKGGYDLDSFGDYLYVNRSSQYLDVYQVTLEDTDGDAKLEPEQHPGNLLDTGPMENRKLSFVKSYSKLTDYVPLGGSSLSGMHAKSDRVFMLGPVHDGSVSEYVFASKSTNVVVAPGGSTAPDGGVVPGLVPGRLGLGEADGLWYGGNFTTVATWHAPTSAWVPEFRVGGNLRGLEVIVAPATGQQYVWTLQTLSSGPYSQSVLFDLYRRGAAGWEPVTRFPLDTGASFGALGFGALNHLWVGAGGTLYEVGGGDCAQYLK